MQVGDQLDRGDHELEILYFLERLQREAARAGGALHVLNGNHEVGPAGFMSTLAGRCEAARAGSALHVLKGKHEVGPAGIMCMLAGRATALLWQQGLKLNHHMEPAGVACMQAGPSHSIGACRIPSPQPMAGDARHSKALSAAKLTWRVIDVVFSE